MIKKTVNCLIELFSEEIPARMQNDAELEFLKLFEKACKSRGISFKGHELYSTPRRLGLFIRNIDEKQENQFIEIKGPSIFAEDRAINGFLKTHNEKKKNLNRKKTKKGEFFFIEKVLKGKNTKLLFPEIIKEIILNFNWPKSQRWGNSEIKWARPLRNILLLIDDKEINGKISFGNEEKIVFSNYTFGHRFYSKKVKIDNIQSYKKK